MADRDAVEGRTGFLARLSVLETLVLAAIALIALAGLMLIGKGFFMKARAEFSQALAKQSFQAHLHSETAGKFLLIGLDPSAPYPS